MKTIIGGYTLKQLRAMPLKEREAAILKAMQDIMAAPPSDPVAAILAVECPVHAPAGISCYGRPGHTDEMFCADRIRAGLGKR